MPYGFVERSKQSISGALEASNSTGLISRKGVKSGLNMGLSTRRACFPDTIVLPIDQQKRMGHHPKNQCYLAFLLFKMGPILRFGYPLIPGYGNDHDQGDTFDDKTNNDFSVHEREDKRECKGDLWSGPITLTAFQ